MKDWSKAVLILISQNDQMSEFERRHGRFQIFITCSVSLELLQGFARGLAFAAFMQNINLSAIKKEGLLASKFPKSHPQANECNNSGESEEVDEKLDKKPRTGKNRQFGWDVFLFLQ